MESLVPVTVAALLWMTARAKGAFEHLKNRHTQSIGLEFFFSIYLSQLSGVSGKFRAGVMHLIGSLALSQVPSSPPPLPELLGM